MSSNRGTLIAISVAPRIIQQNIIKKKTGNTPNVLNHFKFPGEQGEFPMMKKHSNCI